MHGCRLHGALLNLMILLSIHRRVFPAPFEILHDLIIGIPHLNLFFSRAYLEPHNFEFYHRNAVRPPMVGKAVLFQTAPCPRYASRLPIMLKIIKFALPIPYRLALWRCLAPYLMYLPT